jgi:cobalt-zinc-cadmium efflux system protein
MEATPEGVDADEIEHALEALPGVADIHHLHAWCLAPGKPLITLHARVVDDHDSDAVLARIKHALVERFHIDHSTIQMERACADPHHERGAADAHHAGHAPPHVHDRKLAHTQ